MSCTCFSLFSTVRNFIKISTLLRPMKILTDSQATRRLRELSATLNLSLWSLVEDEEELFVVSRDVIKMPLDAYRIRRIGLPLSVYLSSGTVSSADTDRNEE